MHLYPAGSVYIRWIQIHVFLLDPDAASTKNLEIQVYLDQQPQITFVIEWRSDQLDALLSQSGDLSF